ncbi:MAG: SDR family NAD(P)-dependent oxidoreductase [Spongiibacteraceae bacterium]
MRLQKKTAIVTGAAAGIGLAAARLFAREGARVLLVDLNEAALQAAVAEIGDASSSYIVADVSQQAAMQWVVDTGLLRLGVIDIFVANAGIEGVIKPLTEYPVDIFDRVINVNVRGVFLGIRSVLPHMSSRRSGSIIITASGAALHGAPGMAAYIVSKHAVAGLMKVAALEAAAFDVRVNTVNPGPVETRMMRSIEEGNAPGAAEHAHRAGAASIPMQRYAEPEDVAATMLFLAGDESRYCSGGMYSVDGGMSAR